MTDEPVAVATPVHAREFTVRLPAELHERLRDRARGDDQRMSQVVRAAVREYLDRDR